jgi:hypothetical protein
MGFKPRPTAAPTQLVFQVPDDFFDTFDDMVAFEDRLIGSMSRNARVDGHDIGSGTINFFVETEYPLAAFNAFRKYLGTNKIERKLRVAFRPLEDHPVGEWIELWPRRRKRGQKPFDYWYE